VSAYGTSKETFLEISTWNEERSTWDGSKGIVGVQLVEHSTLATSNLC
jgi:hypothetical protein